MANMYHVDFFFSFWLFFFLSLSFYLSLSFPFALFSLSLYIYIYPTFTLIESEWRVDVLDIIEGASTDDGLAEVVGYDLHKVGDVVV